jgi:hypothetical protein
MITRTFIEQLNQSLNKEDQALVMEFFVSFARFECALKTSVFLDGNEEKARPNWDLFISSISQVFDKNYSTVLREAFDYILNDPPRIQFVHDNQLGWKVRSFQDNPPEINRVCLSIRDVRNNLFHGGKFQQDTSRNQTLLNNSILVLNEWLRLSDTVREKYLNLLD